MKEEEEPSAALTSEPEASEFWKQRTEALKRAAMEFDWKEYATKVSNGEELEIDLDPPPRERFAR